MGKSFAAQRAQIGVELTTGTAVPATRKLNSGALTLTPKRETGKIEPGGQFLTRALYEKYASTEGTFEGTPCFRDLRYLLALAFGEPETEEVQPGAYQHRFTLKTNRPTWTAEYGDAQHNSVATSLLATGIKFEWGSNSGDSNVTVNLVGGPLVDADDPRTEATADEDPIPVIASKVEVRVASDQTALGAGLISEALRSTIALSDLATVTRYLGGGVGVTPTRASATYELVAEATPRVRELRATDQVRYVNVATVGPDLPGTTTPSLLQIDFTAQVAEEDRGESDSVYAETLKMEIVTAGGFEPTITLVTDQP